MRQWFPGYLQSKLPEAQKIQQLPQSKDLCLGLAGAYVEGAEILCA